MTWVLHLTVIDIKIDIGHWKYYFKGLTLLWSTLLPNTAQFVDLFCLFDTIYTFSNMIWKFFDVIYRVTHLQWLQILLLNRILTPCLFKTNLTRASQTEKVDKKNCFFAKFYSLPWGKATTTRILGQNGLVDTVTHSNQVIPQLLTHTKHNNRRKLVCKVGFALCRQVNLIF